MIYEHEIPNQSNLYFGHSAKIKRYIENVSSEILINKGYEEILTPLLSYHQHQYIDEKELIKFFDEQNNTISLRCDSTLDVVRVIVKRLDRSTKNRKWFYIQPIFQYPSVQKYQVGAEWIGNSNLLNNIHDSIDIFKALNIYPMLQISNINIPKLISKELNIPIELFQNLNLEKLLNLNISWLNKLIYLQELSQIDNIILDVPVTLKVELENIKKLCNKINYNNLVISPLYYAKMRYYDNLFFRFFKQNHTLGMGGVYNYQNINSSGFALYIDELIEELIK